MRLDVYLHTPAVEVPAWAKAILRKLDLILETQEAIMAEIDDLETAARANTDAEDAVETLLVALSKQISELKNTQTDPATSARIAAVAATLQDRAAKLAAAVVANTPAA